VTTAKTGTVINVIQVKRTDFEVFDALRIDSQDSADMSGNGTYIVETLSARPNVSEKHCKPLEPV